MSKKIEVYFAPYWRSPTMEHLRNTIQTPKPLLESYEGGFFSRCPAHASWLSNFFVFVSPYDFDFTVQRVAPGEFHFEDHNQMPGSIFEGRVAQQSEESLFHIMSLNVHSVVVTNTPNVWLEQFPAFYHPHPAIELIGGHFNIYNWQRPLDVAFKVKYGTRVKIKKGTPLYYIKLFCTEDPLTKFVMQPVQLTDQILELIHSCLDVKEYVKNLSFALSLEQKHQPEIKIQHVQLQH